jgi:pimeloyl-ACP methyl ester carboxylesterase
LQATAAAWKTIPSWYLLGRQDRAITPTAQRFMATRAGSKIVEVNSSHASMVSQPRAVADLIERAAGQRSDDHDD